MGILGVQLMHYMNGYDLKIYWILCFEVFCCYFAEKVFFYIPALKKKSSGKWSDFWLKLKRKKKFYFKILWVKLRFVSFINLTGSLGQSSSVATAWGGCNRGRYTPSEARLGRGIFNWVVTWIYILYYVFG